MPRLRLAQRLAGRHASRQPKNACCDHACASVAAEAVDVTRTVLLPLKMCGDRLEAFGQRLPCKLVSVLSAEDERLTTPCGWQLVDIAGAQALGSSSLDEVIGGVQAHEERDSSSEQRG